MAWHFLENFMTSANLKLSWCLFVWIIYFGRRNKQDQCHTHLWGQSIFHQLGFKANFWWVIAVLCLVLSSDPSDAFAPGSVTNDAFICRCNNHRAANIKQDRCLHHKTNQRPQGDVVASPSFSFFFWFLQMHSPTRHQSLHQGDSWLNKTKGSCQLDASFMMTQQLSNK